MEDVFPIPRDDSLLHYEAKLFAYSQLLHTVHTHRSYLLLVRVLESRWKVANAPTYFYYSCIDTMAKTEFQVHPTWTTGSHMP